MIRLVAFLILFMAGQVHASEDCIDLSGTFLLGTYKNGQELTYKRIDCKELNMSLRSFNNGFERPAVDYVWPTDGVYRKVGGLNTKDRIVYYFAYYTTGSLVQSYVMFSAMEPVQIVGVYETINSLDSSSNLVTREIEKDGKGEVKNQTEIVVKRIK